MHAPSIVDLTLTPTSESSVWMLELQVQVGRGILSDQLLLGLGRSIRAIPPEADLGRTVTLSTTSGASVASVDAGIRVAEGRQQVQIRLPRRMTGVRGLPIRLPVAWVNPLLHAKEIEFDALFTYLNLPVNQQRLVLLNLEGGSSVRANLLRVLNTPDRRFYFPNAPSLIPMSYDDFSPMTGPVQSLPGSTVWGTMWPSELSFWHSRDGCEFLLRQMVRYSEHGQRARRIAVLPDAGTLTPLMCVVYFAELEVHHRMGVDVRIMEASQLREALDGRAEALLCLGDSLGVYYGGIALPISNATAGLLIDTEGIRSMRQCYDEVQPQGVPWIGTSLRRQVLDAPLARSYMAYRFGALARTIPISYLGVALTPKEIQP